MPTPVQNARFYETGRTLARTGSALWVLAVLAAGPLAAAPTIDPPPGHESSSGVAVAGGGFITVTAVWVTPGLTDSLYYQQWLPSAEERQMHRRAAAVYTVMLLELANRSSLTLEGFVSVNVRLLVEGERIRPLADEALARAFPALMPPRRLERISPRETLTRAYAFPRVAPARPVAFLVRPVTLYQERRQIGQLQEFELRFDPSRLTYPP